jgi:hypothetical protein
MSCKYLACMQWRDESDSTNTGRFIGVRSDHCSRVGFDPHDPMHGCRYWHVIVTTYPYRRHLHKRRVNLDPLSSLYERKILSDRQAVSSWKGHQSLMDPRIHRKWVDRSGTD